MTARQQQWVTICAVLWETFDPAGFGSTHHAYYIGDSRDRNTSAFVQYDTKANQFKTVGRSRADLPE